MTELTYHIATSFRTNQDEERGKAARRESISRVRASAAARRDSTTGTIVANVWREEEGVEVVVVAEVEVEVEVDEVEVMEVVDEVVVVDEVEVMVDEVEVVDEGREVVDEGREVEESSASRLRSSRSMQEERVVRRMCISSVREWTDSREEERAPAVTDFGLRRREERVWREEESAESRASRR